MHVIGDGETEGSEGDWYAALDFMSTFASVGSNTAEAMLLIPI